MGADRARRVAGWARKVAVGAAGRVHRVAGRVHRVAGKARRAAARLVREDGEAGEAVGRARVLVAPAQDVEGGVYVALGGEVEPRAHVAQRRAHVVGQPVVELVHALLQPVCTRMQRVAPTVCKGGCERTPTCRAAARLLVRDGVHPGEEVAPQLGEHLVRDLDADLHLEIAGEHWRSLEIAGDRVLAASHTRGCSLRAEAHGRSFCYPLLPSARGHGGWRALSRRLFRGVGGTLSCAATPYSCGTTYEASVRAAP